MWIYKIIFALLLLIMAGGGSVTSVRQGSSFQFILGLAELIGATALAISLTDKSWGQIIVAIVIEIIVFSLSAYYVQKPKK